MGLFGLLKLQFVQLRVDAAPRQELGMRAGLDNRAGVENDDPIRLLHR